MYFVGISSLLLCGLWYRGKGCLDVVMECLVIYSPRTNSSVGQLMCPGGQILL